jgi:predicted GIY-YIG superfamily endonuclease
MKKTYNYWTKEKCHQVALSYQYKIDFINNSNSTYSIACKNKWIDDICKHMLPKRDIWTKEKLIIEAQKYKNNTDFYKNSNTAYNAARYHGILDDICKHMTRTKHKKWTKEEIMLEALNYSTKNEFHNKSSGAYDSAWKNGYLNEVCQHMTLLGNIKNRCIYAIEFPDNYAYIGLTHDINERFSHHLGHKDSAIFQHIKNFNKQPKFKQLTKYINIEEAIKMENYYVNKYSEIGWIILNRSKTGGVGGNSKKWTIELCRIEAKKYKTKIKFSKSSNRAYAAACRYDWINEISKHMISGKIKWTKENCILEALKYTTRSEFKHNSSGAYSAVVANKWLDEICLHMPKFKRPQIR